MNLRELRHAIAAVPTAILRQRAAATLQIDVRAQLPKLTLPTLCLHARQDHLLWPPSVAELQVLLPDARHVSLEGPHLLLQARAEAAAAEVAAWMRASPPDRRLSRVHACARLLRRRLRTVFFAARVLAAFFAAALRAAAVPAFFTAAFFAVFFAAFFVAVLRAGAFFATAFFATAFFAGAFFAAVLLVAAFFVADFLAGAFLAASCWSPSSRPCGHCRRACRRRPACSRWPRQCVRRCLTRAAITFAFLDVLGLALLLFGVCGFVTTGMTILLSLWSGSRRSLGSRAHWRGGGRRQECLGVFCFDDAGVVATRAAFSSTWPPASLAMAFRCAHAWLTNSTAALSFDKAFAASRLSTTATASNTADGVPARCPSADCNAPSLSVAPPTFGATSFTSAPAFRAALLRLAITRASEPSSNRMPMQRPCRVGLLRPITRTSGAGGMSRTGVAVGAGSGSAGRARPSATRCASASSMLRRWLTVRTRTFSVSTLDNSNTSADARCACSGFSRLRKNIRAWL